MFPRSLAVLAAVVALAAGTDGASSSAARRDLGLDEQHGGHTLARHVGLSDDALRDRLGREPRISAASTYTDRSIAEQVVGATLKRNSARVASWSRRSGRRPNLALDYVGEPDLPIGKSLRRGDRAVRWCSNATVVLRWDERRNTFYVLTSYPEAPR